MAVVGDRIQVPSKRVGQAPRAGVVTGVSGAMLRVTWSGGEESTIFPSMGSLMVVGKVRARTKKAVQAAQAPAKKSVKKSAKPAKATKAPSDAKKASKKPSKKPGKAQRAGATKASKRAGRAVKHRK
ncbi:MAG TPA: DUF1918 domain-containing protein [Acidimicrobiales bacterium]